MFDPSSTPSATAPETSFLRTQTIAQCPPPLAPFPEDLCTWARGRLAISFSDGAVFSGALYHGPSVQSLLSPEFQAPVRRRVRSSLGAPDSAPKSELARDQAIPALRSRKGDVRKSCPACLAPFSRWQGAPPAVERRRGKILIVGPTLPSRWEMLNLLPAGF